MDLISRQSVLRLAKDVVLQDGCKHRCIDATMIHELPSAQFDKDINVPDKNVGKIGDLIDRQAAIDAILAVTGNSSVRELYEHVQEHGLSDMWSGGVSAAIDIIIAVPSVHPEIIHCRECKWWGYDDDDGAVRVCHAAKHGFMSSHWDIQIYRTYRGDFWCADAERREDE